MSPYATSLEEFWGLVVRLKDDCQRCLQAIDDAESDPDAVAFWRRTYARAVFAFIDGTVLGLLFQAYSLRNRPELNYTNAEIVRLESYFDFEGLYEVGSGFSDQNMLTDVEFAFTAFARILGSDYTLPVHDPGWLLVKEIDLIRKSLKYGRTTEMVEVFPENVDSLLHGMLWFIERVVDLLQSSKDAALAGEIDDRPDDDELTM
jgi:hypothetical protein